MKTLIVIPARMESKRLPGKPLIEIGQGINRGSLLSKTYEAAGGYDVPDDENTKVIVATPDAEIVDHCSEHHMDWYETKHNCPTGTHRCAETLEAEDQKYDCVVNWQVDEPCIKQNDVHKLIDCITGMGLHKNKARIATLLATISENERQDPNVVKAVWLPAIKGGNICHWFSRAPMAGAYGHIGVYAFDPQTLHKMGTVPVSRHAELESLEQLSWFGFDEIEAEFALETPQSINVPEDIQKLERIFSETAPRGSDQNDFGYGG